ncbi:DUF2264 domain-containing protein [Nonomuraea sp. NPDC048892]|uniref:DUF2264 domain-containing protein n=1 Tax=Nonomuraea sp. NPDC048892 TaxID=3154624 RepID=UPI0033DC6F52
MPRIPDDPALSPYTGWTRAHWAALAERLLLSARPFASPGHARISFPGRAGGYGADVDGLEGFARTFLAAGFRVAGEGGDDPLGLMEWYARGLATGTDPASPERWVRLDEHGQAKVEAASIALVLHLTRPWLWDRLDDGVRERVIAYLAPAVGGEYPPINWVWFQIVVEQFLASVGGPYEPGDIEAGLALTDGFARENGWYADGAERSYDHYAGWALQFYPLLWTEMAAGSPTGSAAFSAAAEERRPVYLGRLERYLHDAVRLVGADGSPLVQGRSLTYRFAAAVPFWLGARYGLDTPSPGLLRRAASGIARHFADRGAPDAKGLLSLGWHGPWRPIAQSYSGPGSPYWAAKGLFGLTLPAGHPAWTAVEEPLPVERDDYQLVVPSPGWLVSGTRADGVVRVVNHGTDHSHPGSHLADSPLYARLAYSTATSPVLAGPHAARPLDQSVALLDASGEPSHRTGFDTLLTERLPTGTAAGASRWRSHWVQPDPTGPDHGSGRPGRVRLGPWLHVLSLVRGPWEVRLVRVGSPDDHTEEPQARLRIGGWPLPSDNPHPGTAAGADATAGAGLSTGGDADKGADVGAGTVAGASAGVGDSVGAGLNAGADAGAGAGVEANGRMCSCVFGGASLDIAGVTSADDASPLAPWTVVPWCATSGPARAEVWHEAVLYLGAGEPVERPVVTWPGPAADPGSGPVSGSASSPGSSSAPGPASGPGTGPDSDPAPGPEVPSDVRIVWPDGTVDNFDVSRLLG